MPSKETRCSGETIRHRRKVKRLAGDLRQLDEPHRLASLLPGIDQLIINAIALSMMFEAFFIGSPVAYPVIMHQSGHIEEMGRFRGG